MSLPLWRVSPATLQMCLNLPCPNPCCASLCPLPGHDSNTLPFLSSCSRLSFNFTWRSIARSLARLSPSGTEANRQSHPIVHRHGLLTHSPPASKYCISAGMAWKIVRPVGRTWFNAHMHEVMNSSTSSSPSCAVVNELPSGLQSRASLSAFVISTGMELQPAFIDWLHI